MPVTPTYPGLYIEEIKSSAHPITPAPTSIAVFVGYSHPFLGTCAENDDWGKPFQIFSFTEYERIFGGLFSSGDLQTDLAYAVYQFFLNGGTNAYVVGLQPQYFDQANGLAPTPIAGTQASLSGIRFEARQLTDDLSSKMTVSIRNRRSVSAGGPNNVADLMITYRNQVEVYRNVRTSAGIVVELTDPNHAVYQRDFIVNRLSGSRLVKISPEGTTYLAEFAGDSVDLGQMSATSPTAVTFRASDFVQVFQDESPLDKVDIFNLLATPGVFDPAVWSAAQAFAERKRAFYVMDAQPDVSADGFQGAPKVQDIELPTTPNGALYFPYLKSIDPVTGTTIEVAPSGFVLGTYARTDQNRGVWKAPAGYETSLNNTTGVVDRGRMTDMRQGELNRRGINVIRSFPSVNTVVWGARTVVSNNPAFPEWRYVPVRRTALFIEQTLMRNLGWVVFEPNAQPLWSAIRISIENFMLSLFRQSAFQGKSPRDAFMVQCDDVTTTPQDIDNGIVNIVVGFRPLKPAEFVIIKIAQLAGQMA